MPSSEVPLSNGHTEIRNGAQNGHQKERSHAKDVGIVAMELYFPSTYVEQSELEVFDGISAGKYTIGHGQERMGFCTDREDIVSFCLTAVDRLMKRTGTSYKKIGRLDVGTETLIDKSKSIKSCLMKLFEKDGNLDVEGVDNLNACYGGTAALFNCVDWIESSAWDGRYAIAVAADIAVYASGNARCTGGAGAVAMLIGPNAGVVFDQGVRSSCMHHAYDFYKPDMASEYPTVDGPYSLRCYMEALEKCYDKFCDKFEDRILNGDVARRVDLGCLSYVVFHSPFTKLVQKSLSRLVFRDFLRNDEPVYPELYSDLVKYRGVNFEDSLADKELEKLLLKISRDTYLAKTAASQAVARNVGNMYTASLYGGIASLIASCSVEELANKRIGMFSYGSGVASSFFSARFVPSSSLTKIVDSFKDLFCRLDRRIKVNPEEYDKILQHKEDQYNSAPYEPTADLALLAGDIYYLSSIDKLHRREYSKTQKEDTNS